MDTRFDSIKQGLGEAIEYQQGKPVGATVQAPSPLDVKAIREQTGRTQESCAARVGVSLGTLRHWERGDRQAHGPARVLLQVIARNPQTGMQALKPEQ